MSLGQHVCQSPISCRKNPSRSLRHGSCHLNEDGSPQILPSENGASPASPPRIWDSPLKGGRVPWEQSHAAPQVSDGPSVVRSRSESLPGQGNDPPGSSSFSVGEADHEIKLDVPPTHPRDLGPPGADLLVSPPLITLLSRSVPASGAPVKPVFLTRLTCSAR